MLVRNPVDRLTAGLPKGYRVTIDWLVTIVGAVLIVLAVKQWVINPYRIPSSSMEPTLHCARPALGCEASISDRVLACRFCYDLWSPKRGDIVVFNTPPEAAIKCGEGGVYVKRLIGLPGDTVHEDKHGYIWINGKELNEPYIQPARRQPRRREQPELSQQDLACAEGPVLLHGRQPRRILRLTYLGNRPTQEPGRQGGCHLLAATPRLGPMRSAVG